MQLTAAKKANGKADVPEGTSYVVVEDRGVELLIEVAAPSIEEARELLATLDAEQRLQAVAERVTPEQAKTLAPLLPEWTADETVAAGALRTHDGVIYEAIQGHTTQDGWEPPETPALWRVWRDPKADVPPEWVRPTGSTDAYGVGERVTHKGSTWTSTAPNNVWEPGTGSLWVEG